MKVTFIAHSGIHVTVGGASVLIDPWFTDSTVDEPIIESIGSSHKTIDFQIPKTLESILDYDPDIILLSHFHTHHAPLRDIVTLCKKATKEVHVFFPETNNQKIFSVLGALPRVRLVAVGEDQQFTVAGITVRGIRHTVEHHRSWFIKGSEGLLGKSHSVLHIADARMNSDTTMRTFDEIWTKYYSLNPDVMFLGAGANSLRRVANDGEHRIIEATVFTPTEAARLVAKIKPKCVSIIGCYNHSVFAGRTEYVLPQPYIEEGFYWAASWLAPETKCFFLKPGDAINYRSEKDFNVS